MTALYIILGLLLFLLLLLTFILSLRLKFVAKYSDTLSLVLKVLFLEYTLVPFPEKKKKKKKRKKPKKQVEEKKDSEKKEKKQSLLKKYTEKNGVDGLVSIISEIAQLVGTTLKGLFEHIVIEKFDVDIIIRGEDAADTALKYGKTCGVFYSAVAIVLGTAKCDDYNLNLTPDFDETKDSEVKGETHFYIRTYYVVLYLLRAGLKLLKIRYKK